MKMLRTGLLASLALFGSACSQLPAGDTPPSAPRDERVVEGRLDNGLRYRLVPTQDQPGRLDIRLRVDAGAVDETADQVGVAHLLEHMLFYNRDARQRNVRQRLQAAGWVQGRHFNAMTSAERTQYLLSPPAGNQDTELALQVLAQLLLQRDFGASELDLERPIVIEEWRGGLGVAQRMNDQRRDSQRVGSRYAGHPPIGSAAAIRQATVASLWDFHQRWYVPNNMQLNIVGDFEPTLLQAQIAQALGTAPRRELPPRELDLPYQPGFKAFRLHDSESGSHQVNLLFRGHYQANRADSPAGQRERLLDRLTSRLLQVQLQRQAAPQGVRKFSMQRAQFGTRSEVLALSAALDESVHEQALQALLEEVQRIRRFGFYQADLDREIDKLRKVAEDMLARGDGRDFADWVQLLNDPSQAERRIQRRSTIARSSLELLDSIRLDEIDQRLRRWTDSEDLVLQMSAPNGRPLQLADATRYQELMAAIDVAALAAPTPYVPPAPVSVPELPAAVRHGSVLGARHYEAERVQYWTLSNGDRLVWLRHPDAAGKAYLQIDASSGYRRPGGQPWLEQSASQMVWASPPQGFDEAQWQAWQQRERLHLGQEQQALHTSFSAEVEAQRLPGLFALYRTRVTLPSLPEEAVVQVRNDLGRSLHKQPPTARQTQEQALARLRFGPQPSGLPDAAELAGLNREQLLAAWQQQMAAPVTYYLAADVPEAQLREWVSRELAGIPRTAVAGGEPLLQLPGARRQRVLGAIEPRATLQVLGYAEHPWTPEDAVRVASLRQLASEALKARLRGEARGLYQLTFDSELNPRTGRLETRLLFSCDPQRLDELWRQADAVLRELPQQIDAARVVRLREELRREERQRLEDGATQLHRLVLSDRRWGDPRYLAAQGRLADALQPEALRGLASQLLPADNRVRLEVLPRPEPEA